MNNVIKYYDADDLNELPKLDKTKRYLEFLGGTKKYRCFIVDRDMPRCDFYKNHLELLEEFLYPIYKNRGILVAQDNTFPLPGFYILSYDKKYNSVDEIPESLSIRTSFLLSKIRKLMRTKLNIQFVNIYYEEKNLESNNVHYWILPKNNDVNCLKKLYEFDLKKYLYQADYKKNKDKIIEYNQIIKKALVDENYSRVDDELYNKFEKIEKKINLCISKYCFLKCKGCYNNFCALPEITYEQIITFLEYAKNEGLERVTLSGGDPLTRTDIDKIISKCIDLNLKVNMDTVGLPFISDTKILGEDKTIEKFTNYNLLKKIDVIGIPLDGASNEIISNFRIYKDNLFNEIIEILNIFEKNNINVCINTVLHKQNIRDLNNILNVVNRYNCIKKWQIFQYMPIGPLGKKNEELFSIDRIEFNNAKEELLKINKSNINIEFKASEERAHNYMLIDSSGKAYKVDLANKMETFGNISDKKTWENIMNNLF